MIGIFDSGVGGLTVLSEIRRVSPDADICFYKDTKNAPYGTKSRGELLRLVKRDISRLCLAGADKILMACCTASTVYDGLPEPMRSICTPIIVPTARTASQITKSGRVGVIATSATTKSHAFSRALLRYAGVKEVFEFDVQELVSLIEGGARDGRLNDTERERLACILRPIAEKNIDTLILGCTHFPHLEGEIAKMLPGVRLVSSSREGAFEMMKKTNSRGKGLTVYL